MVPVRKSILATLKVEADGRNIIGYAATFRDPANPDHQLDIVPPGAFAKTLAERMPKGLIGYCREHQSLIGRLVEATEDEVGLMTVGHVSKTMAGDETLELVRDGVMRHMSFDADVIKSEVISNELGRVRILKELRLREVGPCMWPADEDTRIVAVKSFDPEVLRGGPGAVRKSLGLFSEIMGMLAYVRNAMEASAPLSEEERALIRSVAERMGADYQSIMELLNEPQATLPAPAEVEATAKSLAGTQRTSEIMAELTAALAARNEKLGALLRQS